MSNNENIIHHNHEVTKQQRAKLKKQQPCVLWFTGLSGSGKSTIANALELKLNQLQKHTYLLDGDNIRLGLNKDLAFSDEDRIENIRRIGEVAKLFVDAGTIVLTAFISPFRKDRQSVRDLLNKDEFIEIYINTPLEVCESRDPKGLYKKVRQGKIVNFTGISSLYEAPTKADIYIQTDIMAVNDSVKLIIEYLKEKGYI